MRVFGGGRESSEKDSRIAPRILFFVVRIAVRENAREGTPLLSLSITALSQPRACVRVSQRAARKIAALAKPTIIEGSAGRSLACVRACVRAYLRARAYVWSCVSMCIPFSEEFFPREARTVRGVGYRARSFKLYNDCGRFSLDLSHGRRSISDLGVTLTH